ncbi:hypothetical protein CRYUN_Cryun07bG0068300 [Craigia yunnanensis]
MRRICFAYLSALRTPNSFLRKHNPIHGNLFAIAPMPIHPPFTLPSFFSIAIALGSHFTNVAKLYATIMDNCNAYDNMEKSLDHLTLQLTTPLVLELLQRLSLEEKITFSFFTWAANQQCSAHQPQAYNQMIDILSNTNLVEDAEVLFERMKMRVKLDANSYNILFFVWCRVRNPKRGMKVLEEMIQLAHSLDNFTYNTAIDTFCKARMVTEAAELFEFMRTKGSTMSFPTAKTYVIITVALMHNNRTEECFELIGHMINSGYLSDVSTYKELIEGMCLAGKIEEGDLDGVFETWQEMDKRGCTQDIETYCIMIDGLFSSNHVEDACFLLEDVVNKGLKLLEIAIPKV